MKLILTLLAFVICSHLFGQTTDYVFCISFEPNEQWLDYNTPGNTPLYFPFQDSTFLKIDKTLHHNRWQIGRPGKVRFTSAYNSVNAIVTDSLMPCTPGDTSVFVLNLNSSAGSSKNLSFLYKLDIDTGDIVAIESSKNNGITWVNFLSDSVSQFLTPKPDLTISTSGWDSVYLSAQANFQDVYRFTFISGPSTKSRDGFMIDNIRFRFGSEGVGNTVKTIAASISPNPATSHISIKYSLQHRENLTITIDNFLGQKVKELLINNGLSGVATIPVDELPTGVYFYTLKTSTAQTTGKILVQH